MPRVVKDARAWSITVHTSPNESKGDRPHSVGGRLLSYQGGKGGTAPTS